MPAQQNYTLTKHDMTIITLSNEQETEQLGAALQRLLPEKCLVFLKGELGAGKTTLTRGFLRAAGHQAAVKSPTYTLVEEYDLAAVKFYHFDLYRIKDPEELEWIGLEDYFAQNCQCFIEWPQNGEGLLPEADIILTLKVEQPGRRINVQVLSGSLKNKLHLYWKNNDIVL